MTGKLHLPVPALIIAAPIYRGEGFFMLILLLSTLAVVGPAWCSHLCYIGAWDLLASTHKKPIKTVNRKRIITIRYLVIIAIILIALAFNLLNINAITAFSVALIFGFTGIILMIFLTRKKGYMVHCTQYCPIGGLVVLFSKIYPLRLRIDKNSCTLCQRCIPTCRYEALSLQNIKSTKAGWNCTFCGDCIESCQHQSIRLSFIWSQKNVWKYYIALIVAVHSVFLALARL